MCVCVCVTKTEEGVCSSIFVIIYVSKDVEDETES